MSTRVYLPLTATALRRAVADGQLGPAPLTGQAVTDALAGLVGGDDEENEYAALTAAAMASLALLGDDDPPFRLVAAVDVSTLEAGAGADDERGPGAVVVPYPVPLRRLAAVHADSPDAAGDVADARAELAGGTEDGPAWGRCLDRDLGWFAPQEVDALLEDLGAR